MHNNKISLIFLMGILAFSLNGFGKAETEKKKNTVKAAILQSVTVRDEFSVLGEVLSAQASEIKSPENMIVKKVHVKVGDRVKKGQTLIELIKQDQDLSFNSRKILSSINGTVTSFALVVGQYVSTQQSLIKIANLDKLYVQTYLTWDQFIQLKKTKNQADFFHQDQKINLTIRSLGQAMDELGSVPLSLVCEKCSSELIYKSQMVIKLKLQKRKFTLVPKDAVFYIGEDTFINRLNKTDPNDKHSNLFKSQRVKVELGETFQDKQILLHGLELNQWFVANNQKFIAQDEEVEVSNLKELTTADSAPQPKVK